MDEINTANNIYVSTAGDYALRRRSQTIALSYTGRMLGQMMVAYEKFGIESRRIKHWTQLVVDVRELVKNWRKADSERYKKIK